MAEKSQNADSGKEIKEKKINKKEKKTQQQKGLPTLSADLNNSDLNEHKWIPMKKLNLYRNSKWLKWSKNKTGSV